MKRLVCLGVMILTGLFAIVATNEARQPRSPLHLQEVATNLYMLGNEPGGEGMRGGGNTGIFVGSAGRHAGRTPRSMDTGRTF